MPKALPWVIDPFAAVILQMVKKKNTVVVIHFNAAFLCWKKSHTESGRGDTDQRKENIENWGCFRLSNCIAVETEICRSQKPWSVKDNMLRYTVMYKKNKKKNRL